MPVPARTAVSSSRRRRSFAPGSPACDLATDTEIQRVRELLNGSQFAAAAAASEALVAAAPENRDVLYMLAVSQRYLNRIPEALATLAELEKYHPDYGRLFQERGHCYVTRRAAEPAIEAFTRAVALNGSLPASWR